MAQKLYRQKLRQLKKHGVKINVDARKSDKNLSPSEKAKITRAAKKFEYVANDYHIKKHVGEKTAAILESRGMPRQGNNIWIPKNGRKGNELTKIRVKNKGGYVDIYREFENGETTSQRPLADQTEFFNRAEQMFNDLPDGQALTIQIGSSGPWRNRYFFDLKAMLNYVSQLFNEIAEREETEYEEIEAELLPEITIVDYHKKIDLSYLDE